MNPATPRSMTPIARWADPRRGTHRGPDGVARFFRLVAETWTFQAFNPGEYVAPDDTVVLIGNYAATSKRCRQAGGGGVSDGLDHPRGKVTHFQEYTDTLAPQKAMEKRVAAQNPCSRSFAIVNPVLTSIFCSSFSTCLASTSHSRLTRDPGR